MKQYRFKGNPNQYGWDIPLKSGHIYPGNTKVIGDNTLQKILDLGIDPHDKEFEKEWEEVSNESREKGHKKASLTKMQKFFLDTINMSDKGLNANHISSLWYESIGKRRHVASRAAFGQTSAAYRTCRKLVSLNLIREIHYKTSGGYSYSLYESKRKEATNV